MRNKFILIIYIAVLMLTYCSCDADPHHNKRPINYPNSTWVCNEGEYYFCLSIDDNGTQQAYWGTNTTQKNSIRFLWNGLDSGVIVYVIDESDEKETTLFAGKCTFDQRWFQISITDRSEYMPNTFDVLLFERISSSETEP